MIIPTPRQRGDGMSKPLCCETVQSRTRVKLVVGIDSRGDERNADGGGTGDGGGGRGRTGPYAHQRAESESPQPSAPKLRPIRTVRAEL